MNRGPVDPGARLASELLARESALARRDPSRVQQPLEEQLAPEFFEFGASGRAWERSEVVEGLAAPPREVQITDFRVTVLAADLALATYRSVEPPEDGSRVSLRSSVWILRDGRWRMRFHQGTVVGSREHA